MLKNTNADVNKRSFLWNAFFWLRLRSVSLHFAGLLLPNPSPLPFHHLLPAILGWSQINWGRALVSGCAQPIYFGTVSLWLNSVKTSTFDTHIFLLLPARPHFRERTEEKKWPTFFCNFCTIKLCLCVSIFLCFYYRPHCLGCNTHSLVLRCLSSLFNNKNKNSSSLGFLGVCGLFCLVMSQGLKPSFLSVVKTCFCVYTVCPGLFFLSGFIGIMWSGKFLNNNQHMQNNDPWWQ